MTETVKTTRLMYRLRQPVFMEWHDYKYSKPAGEKYHTAYKKSKGAAKAGGIFG